MLLGDEANIVLTLFNTVLHLYASTVVSRPFKTTGLGSVLAVE